MKDFYRFANKKMNQYYLSKVILYCLSIVVLLAGIITAVIIRSVWLGLMAWFLCLVFYYAGNYMRYMQSSWCEMVQLCPECKSTDIELRVDETKKGVEQYYEFTCTSCGHKWNKNKDERL